MEYRLVRSNRKTLSLEITPQGEVLVRAPKRCSRGYIDAFVAEKAPWIQAHQQQVQHMLEERREFALHTGDMLPFCGRQLQVRLAPGCRVYLTGDRIYLPRGEVGTVLAPLLAAYKTAGAPWLQQRLDFWAEKMGITYTKFQWSTARRRWGSCTWDGVIRISVYLLFAQTAEIDYVLVHELAHRRVFDHSAAFWAVVETYLPDWKQRRRNLGAVQQRLTAQGFYGE